MVSTARHLLLCALAWLALPAHAAAPDWLLEADLTPRQIPVHTQAIYRLRFFQGTDIRDLSITGPTFPLGEVRPLDSGRVIELQRDGRRYRVHERRYLVTPYAAGEQSIAGARVEGLFPQDAPGAKARPLRLVAEALTLSATPTPPGHHLAAHALSLGEHWEMPAVPELRPGQTIRRQIRIEAAGIDAARLPAVQFEIPGLSIHAEPAKFDNQIQNDRNVATRTQTFVLTPRQSGAIEIPALTLTWWRPHDQRSQQASLPPRTLQVAGTPSRVATPTAAPASATPWWAIALGGTFGLIAAAAWFYRTRLRLAGHLAGALRTGNPAGIRDAILAWAGHRMNGQSFRTLGMLADAVENTDTRQAAARLDQIIYGGGARPSSGSELAQLAEQIKRGIRQQAPAGPRKP